LGQINYPRSDRVLVLLAYILSELMVVGLFFKSEFVSEKAWVYRISHTLLVILFATGPAVVLAFLFQVGYAQLIRADHLALDIKTKQLNLKIERLVLLEESVCWDDDGDISDNERDKKHFHDLVHCFDIIVHSFVESRQHRHEVYGWVEYIANNVDDMIGLIKQNKIKELDDVIQTLLKPLQSKHSAAFPHLQSCSSSQRGSRRKSMIQLRRPTITIGRVKKAE